LYTAIRPKLRSEFSNLPEMVKIAARIADDEGFGFTQGKAGKEADNEDGSERRGESDSSAFPGKTVQIQMTKDADVSQVHLRGLLQLCVSSPLKLILTHPQVHFTWIRAALAESADPRSVNCGDRAGAHERGGQPATFRSPP